MYDSSVGAYDCVSTVEYYEYETSSVQSCMRSRALRHPSISITATFRKQWLVLLAPLCRAERCSCQLSVRPTGSSFICVYQGNKAALCLKSLYCILLCACRRCLRESRPKYMRYTKQLPRVGRSRAV